ncbi:phosphotransferase family protein [Sphingomonas solaris]|uniref:Phosphotransferase family protein n=1 Tax=Alterirhizorhabdus solaris TaxID=2529389 RepID=A0A558R1T4_9SPHN|nr:phosphotransferase family protein [Sphingomonas solaris]TVV73343.1 phosphotransferase family protein [Sphingomonas solaris]
MSDMEDRIAAYLAHRMPDARGIAVDDLSRIAGGSSQETFRFRAVWDEGDGPAERRLILRRAPPAGLVVAERDVEFSVYRALADSGVPVPRVYFMEMDDAWLERPFFIMAMAPGKPGHFWTSTDPFEGQAHEVGQRFWRHLGTLAAQDHAALGLTDLRNGTLGDGFWSAELRHWEALLDEHEAMTEPAVRGAIRWLRANPPSSPARPAIVHGDYRVGNFLFTPDGAISAVLDWEMCHVGDPLEDVAWAIDPMWTIESQFPLEDGLAAWETESGIAVDRVALDWWRLFACVKACAIWTTAAASFAAGRSRDMALAMTGVRGQSFHRTHLLALMADKGAMG